MTTTKLTKKWKQLRFELATHKKKLLKCLALYHWTSAPVVVKRTWGYLYKLNALAECRPFNKTSWKRVHVQTYTKILKTLVSEMSVFLSIHTQLYVTCIHDNVYRIRSYVIVFIVYFFCVICYLWCNIGIFTI